MACPSYHPGYDYGIERVGRWAAQTKDDYWGYYDSLSETGVGAYEERLKKRYGHA